MIYIYIYIYTWNPLLFHDYYLDCLSLFTTARYGLNTVVVSLWCDWSPTLLSSLHSSSSWTSSCNVVIVQLLGVFAFWIPDGPLRKDWRCDLVYENCIFGKKIFVIFAWTLNDGFRVFFFFFFFFDKGKELGCSLRKKQVSGSKWGEVGGGEGGAGKSVTPISS